MAKKRKKAPKKRGASGKKHRQQASKTARTAQSRAPELSPFLKETVAGIDESFKRLKVAEHEFQVAKKRDPKAPNEALRVCQDVGDAVNAFKAGPSYGTDAVKQLAEAAGSSASSLAMHASFAELPSEVVERLVQEGRTWRWVSANMSKLVAEKSKKKPEWMGDFD